MAKKDKSEELINNNNQFAKTIIETDIPPFLINSYNQYISYITAGRVLCNYKDGFLNVYRRILYSAREVCRNKYVKAATLNGHVIGHYHPHSSPSSSTISLISNGFIDIEGSGENNLGVYYMPAAADRYIEVKLNSIAEILFLNNDLLPYVDYNLSELSTPENEIYEPMWLPVLLPGMYTAIANTSEFESYMEKGIKPIYPRFQVLTLIDYVLNYLQTGTFDKNIVYYQYHNMLKRCNNDINNKIEEEFKCYMEIDDKNMVHILAKSPFIKMETRLKDIPFTDLTTNYTDIVFPKKYIDYNKFKSVARFNMIAYKMIDNEYENVVLKEYSLQFSILTILDNLKNILFPRYFTDKINKVNEEIKEYELLKIVHDKYINQHIPYDQMTDEEQKCAGRHRTSAFLNIDKKINELNNQLNEYQKRSSNIDQEVLNLYIDAKDKISKYMQKYWEEENIKYYDVTDL